MKMQKENLRQTIVHSLASFSASYKLIVFTSFKIAFIFGLVLSYRYGAWRPIIIIIWRKSTERVQYVSQDCVLWVSGRIASDSQQYCRQIASIRKIIFHLPSLTHVGGIIYCHLLCKLQTCVAEQISWKSVKYDMKFE